jgi:hypothetical protein
VRRSDLVLTRPSCTWNSSTVRYWELRRLRKNSVARRNLTGSHGWDNRRIAHRMLKKAVQQGRSERKGEAYASVR